MMKKSCLVWYNLTKRGQEYLHRRCCHLQNNQKRGGLSRLGDFFAGKGFYIVLFLCVAAIGVSGYFLLTDSLQPTQSVAKPTQVVVTPTPAAPTPALPVATPSPTPKPTPTPAPTPTPTPTTTPTPTPTPAPTPAALVFTWPVKGEILSAHSMETLAYDETMGDWRTHAGLDIAAVQGTQVVATAQGTVIDVSFDELMGSTVVIEHQNGLESKYCNLAAKPTVAVGDEVETGTVIGSVGATAAAEGAKASHLHFELSKDAEAVDPTEYLPKLL